MTDVYFIAILSKVEEIINKLKYKERSVESEGVEFDMVLVEDFLDELRKLDEAERQRITKRLKKSKKGLRTYEI